MRPKVFEDLQMRRVGPHLLHPLQKRLDQRAIGRRQMNVIGRGVTPAPGDSHGSQTIDGRTDQGRFRGRERLLARGAGSISATTSKNQATPASIMAAFGAIAVSRKRSSGSGASTATTSKRGAYMAANRRGSAA